MAERPDPFPAFSATLREALGRRLDSRAEAFLDMVAEDVVMEFPYAPPGSLTRLVGRAALADYLDAVADMVAVDAVDLERVHGIDADGAVVIEFTGTGRGRGGGAYEQRYISVIDLRDGRIARYRDYWNPLALPSADSAS